MKLNTKFNYPKSIRAYYNGQRLYDIGNEKLPSVTTILSATESEEKKQALPDGDNQLGKNKVKLFLVKQVLGDQNYMKYLNLLFLGN